MIVNNLKKKLDSEKLPRRFSSFYKTFKNKYIRWKLLLSQIKLKKKNNIESDFLDFNILTQYNFSKIFIHRFSIPFGLIFKKKKIFLVTKKFKNPKKNKNTFIAKNKSFTKISNKLIFKNFKKSSFPKEFFPKNHEICLIDDRLRIQYHSKIYKFLRLFGKKIIWVKIDKTFREQILRSFTNLIHDIKENFIQNTKLPIQVCIKQNINNIVQSSASFDDVIKKYIKA